MHYGVVVFLKVHTLTQAVCSYQRPHWLSGQRQYRLFPPFDISIVPCHSRHL